MSWLWQLAEAKAFQVQLQVLIYNDETVQLSVKNALPVQSD